MMKPTLRNLFAIAMGGLLLAGCATMSNQPADPLAKIMTPEGKVVWQQEYQFDPPPKPWNLIDLDEDDISLAFFRGCQDSDPGVYPCESTFAYAEEPFGYSQDLQQRQAEFFRRFLWAARVNFQKPQLTPVQVLGAEGLQADIEGFEPVLKHKVWARVVFAKRGERVVAFYLTQWRSQEAPYDKSVAEDFDRFVRSFRFLKPSFYQTL